jgi:hypothetical protein
MVVIVGLFRLGKPQKGFNRYENCYYLHKPGRSLANYERRTVTCGEVL